MTVFYVLLYRSAKEHDDKAFRWMWLTIVLSFGFYIPVVLWADTIPLIGMLMIPKTCAYVCCHVFLRRNIQRMPNCRTHQSDDRNSNNILGCPLGVCHK